MLVQIWAWYKIGAQQAKRLERVARGTNRLERVAGGARRLERVARGAKRLERVARGANRLERVAGGARRPERVAYISQGGQGWINLKLEWNASSACTPVASWFNFNQNHQQSTHPAHTPCHTPICILTQGLT